MTPPNLSEVDLVVLDAIAQAERLAYASPDKRAAIYVSKKEGKSRYWVRPEEDPAPEGAELLTTISRRPSSSKSMLLKDAVAQVLSNLPGGVELLDKVVVEYFPRKYATETAEVFAYQFMSKEGRNVATWIPTVNFESVQMLAGFDGRGRHWHYGTTDGFPTRDITWEIRQAVVVPLDPGPDCTEKFVAGWRMAEDFLRDGLECDDSTPNIPDEEKYNGFIGRMAEQKRRAVIKVTKPLRDTPRVIGNLTEGIAPLKTDPNYLRRPRP